MVSRGWTVPAAFLYFFPAASSMRREDQSAPLYGNAASAVLAKRRRDVNRIVSERVMKPERMSLKDSRIEQLYITNHEESHY
jgi:hypothetical protein